MDWLWRGPSPHTRQSVSTDAHMLPAAGVAVGIVVATITAEVPLLCRRRGLPRVGAKFWALWVCAATASDSGLAARAACLPDASRALERPGGGLSPRQSCGAAGSRKRGRRARSAQPSRRVRAGRSWNSAPQRATVLTFKCRLQAPHRFICAGAEARSPQSITVSATHARASIGAPSRHSSESDFGP